MVPELVPLDAPQTLEARRERQRLHVKRSYYRKLMAMQELRATVEQLEAEVARLELQKQTNPSEEAVRTNNSTEFVSAARQRFDEILEVKAKLRNEKAALERALAEHNRYALKAASWIRVGRLVSSDEEESKAPTPTRGPLQVSLLAPITVDTCRAIAQETFQGVERFNETQNYHSTGVSLFGWRDKRIRSGDRVVFSLTKEFRNISAVELFQRGWTVIGATSGLSRLYSSSMNVQVVSVQRVNDDNEIKLRVMTRSDGRARVKTLFLVSRFAIATGYVYIIRSLDPTTYLVPLAPTDEIAEQWVDYHNWSIFESQGDAGEHCRLEFGGRVQSNAITGSDTWMLEVLLVALRWESIVLEPVFRICHNQAA